MLTLAGAFSALAERIELKTASARCTVETVGARVISFSTADSGEVLWNAAPEQGAEASRWGHGGVPVCWPWFGVTGKGDYHGTAWQSPFAVVSRVETAGRSELVLATETPGARLECRAILTDELRLELTTVNASAKPLLFSAAFHPYFRVGERDRVVVTGLGEKPLEMNRTIDDVFPAGKGSCSVYRIVDPSLDRTVTVIAENATDVNVWNPGPERDTPGTIAEDDWRKFVCVEPMQGSWGSPRTLAPGGKLHLMMGVSVSKGSAVTGFAGRDPRYPGFPDKTFALPFRVMFVGAHPDDADYQFGATATRLVRAGARVTFVSVCNGDNGHQTMDPDELAARRYNESQAAAKAYGVDRYVIMGEHDCRVEATVDLRQRIVRLIRTFAPHLVITHRTCDYHADHRATGQAVQDATYLMGVPLFCPDTPVPETLPFVMYAGDRFTMPRPFRPDLLVDGDEALDTTLRALACHESQLFEWLPPEYGVDPKTIPADSAGRLDYLRRNVPPDLFMLGETYRDVIDRTFGGKGPRYVEAFEVCEYARPPAKKEIDYLASLGFRWVKGAK